MWGCVKAPLGSSLVPKAFLWGHFFMGESGSECVSSGLDFQSYVQVRDIFRFTMKT